MNGLLRVVGFLVCQVALAGPFVVAPGYGQSALSATLIPGNLDWDEPGFFGPGAALLDGSIDLFGAPVGPAPAPMSSLTGLLNLWNEPLVPMFLHVSPGCCHMTFYSDGVTLQENQIGSLELTFLDAHLTGVLHVDRNGVAEVWDLDARLTNPSSGSFLVQAVSDHEARVLSFSTPFPLSIDLTQRSGGGHISTGVGSSLLDGGGSFFVVPEPGSLALSALGLIVVFATSRSFRNYGNVFSAIHSVIVGPASWPVDRRRAPPARRTRR